MRLSALVQSIVIAGASSTVLAQQVTFNKDVLPVLQKNCQVCHRPGEAAPMPLMTYKETRPWAKAIKSEVLSRKMPPWFADPKYGHFQNERLLTESEIKTLVSWVDNGAAEGDVQQKPNAVRFIEGWNIRPDVVIGMPTPYKVPASGTVEYTYYVVPTNFDHDVWVTAAEVRPGDRSVIHHASAFIRPAGSLYLKDAKPGVPFVPKAPQRDANGAEIPVPRPKQQPSINTQNGRESTELDTQLLVTYAPGLPAQKFNTVVPEAALLIPAGSDIVIQMHYTPNGHATTDQTQIGLTLAAAPPKYRYLPISAQNETIEIPPNDANYESHASLIVNRDVRLVWLLPHMHVRGKDFLYTASYPSGERETLLSVPRYDFNWQLIYDEARPIVLPKGTRIDCTAHFDNSANNPYNPNPNVTVRWGDQSWEEMLIGWVGVIVDANVKPENLLSRQQSIASE
jgi:hypothetical protein